MCKGGVFLLYLRPTTLKGPFESTFAFCGAYAKVGVFCCISARQNIFVVFRHAPSLNKFRVGIHSESTFASCGTYAKVGVFRQAQRLSYYVPTGHFMQA